jgi:phage terminase Nu1 subunit (DNA packaging protein)
VTAKGLWLSRQEVADIYGVGVRSVRNWVQRGHVVERVRNGRREVSLASVQAYLDDRSDGVRRNAELHTKPREAS